MSHEDETHSISREKLALGPDDGFRERHIVRIVDGGVSPPAVVDLDNAHLQPVLQELKLLQALCQFQRRRRQRTIQTSASLR